MKYNNMQLGSCNQMITIIIGLGIILSCSQKETLPDPLEAGWEGEKVCELLIENDELRVMKCTFHPGVGHEKHYHDAYFGYALSGGKFRIKDESGTRDVDLKTGNSFFEEGIDWHEVVNIGDSTSVFLIVEPR